jgi:hypothetical protein
MGGGSAGPSSTAHPTFFRIQNCSTNCHPLPRPGPPFEAPACLRLRCSGFVMEQEHANEVEYPGIDH